MTEEKVDLLTDVKVILTLDMGGVSVKFSELMSLSPGALLSLNEQVDDPIKLYANGKLIAEGQMMIANGQYTLKII